MLSCKKAQVNKVFLRLMCLYGGALDGWTEFWRMTFCPSFPNQILSWSHRDVNIGLSCFASHGRNNNSGKKKKNTSAICCSVWSCISVSLEWSWGTNAKLKLHQKASSSSKWIKITLNGKPFEMGRAESLHRNLNQRIFIATLRTWLYVQRTIGALRPHFLSHFLRVSILRWSH